MKITCILQATRPPAFLHNSQTSTVQATAPPAAEDLELAMAINASIQSAAVETPIVERNHGNQAILSTSGNNSVSSASQIALGMSVPKRATPSDEAGTSSNSVQQPQAKNGDIPSTQTGNVDPERLPSAPPAIHEIIEEGAVLYPTIDLSPINISSPVENFQAITDEKKEDGGSSSCVICLDAPIEGACIPCGHMAGCMSCLNEIKAKKWGCPVCRAKIEQVIRLYAV
uniref:Putative E3 ubiquitin-protein ligase XBAT34 isoform X2 n=1 Tax=Rhizophora mucronata TaxID=61149 RepID=A0A2P2L3K9_RHIMU